MRAQFEHDITPIPEETNPDDAEHQRGDFAAAEAVPIATIGKDDAVAAESGVAQQRAAFREALRCQQILSFGDRLGHGLDVGVFPVACEEIRKTSAALSMNAAHIEEKFPEWLFTDHVPQTSVNSDAHWREVHAMGADWRDLARIGVRYASIGTSEADVERLLREQKDIQGLHGVNYGTETLHARLCLRHEEGI
jgi:hypothetical protein